MSDRTVHATYYHAPYGVMEIVRYDRAGKWYLEPADRSPRPSHLHRRQFAQVADAVDSAIWGLEHGGEIFHNRPGGQVFDKKVREIRDER